MKLRQRKAQSGSEDKSFEDRLLERVDIDRLKEIMARMQRGDRCPIDPEWLKGLAPLSDPERGQIKGVFARNRQLQPALSCMAPILPRCDKPPIDSHSMQKGGPLSVLAEKHHVFVLRFSQSIVEKASTYMQLTPIRRATVFPGLCATHDALLFEPIDRHSLREPTSEQIFLLAYRAALRSLYIARQMARERRANLEAMLDHPSGAGVLEMFVASFLRIELALPQLEDVAETFAHWHREGMKVVLPVIVGKNMPTLPFAVSCYIEPPYDEEGKPIEYSGDVRPFIILNVIPEHEGSTVTICFLEEHRHALDSLLSPLKACTQSRDFADRIWQLSLRYSDNLVVAPAAWRAISEEDRQRIIKFADDTRDGGFVFMLPWLISLLGDS